MNGSQPSRGRRPSTGSSRGQAHERAISGTKLITSYFSPSPSPASYSSQVRPQLQYPAVNPLAQFQERVQNGSNIPPSLPGPLSLFHTFPDNHHFDQQPPEKRRKLDEVLHDNSMFQTMPHADLMLPFVPQTVQGETKEVVDIEELLNSWAEAETVENSAGPVFLYSSSDMQDVFQDSKLHDNRVENGQQPNGYPATIQTDDTERMDIDHEEHQQVVQFRDSEEDEDMDGLWEEYDPYADILQTPRKNTTVQPIVKRELRTNSSPVVQTHLPSSTLKDLYQSYELFMERATRKPYMSKRARGFLSHLGKLDDFNRLQDQILHVDFSQEEVELLKEKANYIPGRSSTDILRFQKDYPDYVLDYSSPSFLKIGDHELGGFSRSDHISRPRSLLHQRQSNEIGRPRPQSDRQLHMLYKLKPCSTFNYASGDVIDFKFSPASDQFAVCCNTLTNDYNRPGNLLFGDARGETVMTLDGHFDPTPGVERYYTVSDIRFSNDGQYLYSGSYDNTVKIWDMNGEMLNCLTGHGRITALSTTSCADWVMSVASDDGNIYLYNVYEPKSPFRTIIKSPSERLCGSFLVPGKGFYKNWMLAGYEGKDSRSPIGALYIYDIPKATMVQRVSPASNTQTSAFFHPATYHFVVGSVGQIGAGPTAKSVVRLYDPRLEKALMELSLDSPQKDINKVTISPCGNRITSSGTDGRTIVWDLRVVRSEPDPLHILSHGPTKMVPPVDGQLEDWDTGVMVAEWLPQSDYLITGGSDGCIKLWDTRLGTPFVRDIGEFESAVSGIDFNCNRDVLGVGEVSGKVTFLDWHGVSGGEGLRKFRLKQAVGDDVGNEGILASRELLASGKFEIREYHGLRSVFAV